MDGWAGGWTDARAGVGRTHGEGQHPCVQQKRAQNGSPAIWELGDAARPRAHQQKAAQAHGQRRLIPATTFLSPLPPCARNYVPFMTRPQPPSRALAPQIPAPSPAT